MNFMNKKRRIYFKKTFLSIVLLTVVFYSTSIEVYAQVNAGSYSGGGSYNSSGSLMTSFGGGGDLEGYIKDLAPAIIKLPLCKKVLKDAGNDLFGKIKDSFSSNKVKEVSPATDENQSLLDDSSETGGAEIQAVPVDSTNLNKTASEIKSTADEIKKSTASIDKNDSCLKSIGRVVVKMLLQKITISTVDWINHGFNGKPTFIDNKSGFWKDIAENEILSFGAEINNPALFPFGRDFMIAQAEDFNSHFARNAQYSLDKLIADTNPGMSSIDFKADFSVGGWASWQALTQIPANNPLGFQLIAQDELSSRLEGTVKSNAEIIKEDLDRSMGFLTQKHCADPYGMTEEEEKTALLQNGKDENGNIIGGCKAWRDVTPGSLIADAAIRTTKYPENNLLKAEDLNDAMAAILDALLNQGAQWLTSQAGYAGISNQGADGSLFLSGAYQNTNNNTNVENTFPSYLISSWLSENPDFDIRKDLTQAVIDEQRIYIQKLQDQNDQLFTVVKTPKQAVDLGLKPNYTSFSTGNYGLIPIINQLDYCLPGPHAGFEESARDTMQAIIANGGVPVSPWGIDPYIDAMAFLDSFSPHGGITNLVNHNNINSLVKAFGGKDLDENKAQEINVGIINNIAGVTVVRDSNVSTFEQVSTILETMVERYITVVHNIYNNTIMPSITKEANSEFKKTNAYTELMRNNSEKIQKMTGVVKQLTTLKTNIDNLNNLLALPTTDPNHIDQNTYDEEMKKYITSFGRMSSNMVTGDNIAEADTLLKQIKDKEVYIYNELLKGDNGCEEQIQVTNPNRPNLPWGFVQYKRYPYPLPILYDYNGYDQGVGLPDVLYEAKVNNPKAIFNINQNRKQSFGNSKVGPGKYNGKTGLAGVTFGGVPNNGANDPNTGNTWWEYLQFCMDIDSILGQSSDCQNYSGPTYIYIKDMVNIHVEADAQKLEKTLGIY